MAKVRIEVESRRTSHAKFIKPSMAQLHRVIREMSNIGVHVERAIGIRD